MKNLLKVLTLVFIIGCGDSTQTAGQQKQTSLFQRKVEEATFRSNRVFFSFPSNEDTITFYTDTGGGKVIYPETVEKLRLKIDSSGSGANLYESVDLTGLFSSRGFPVPLGSQFVYRRTSQLGRDNGGMLGANWFANKIWNFDYRSKELLK